MGNRDSGGLVTQPSTTKSHHHDHLSRTLPRSSDEEATSGELPLGQEIGRGSNEEKALVRKIDCYLLPIIWYEVYRPDENRRTTMRRTLTRVPQ